MEIMATTNNFLIVNKSKPITDANYMVGAGKQLEKRLNSQNL
jgi:hypothetical protein